MGVLILMLPLINISSNDIRLGSKNATQPVLLGNETIDIMLELSYAIRSLAQHVTSSKRLYPEGVLKTSFNSSSGKCNNLFRWS
jgi:hypothetical protein